MAMYSAPFSIWEYTTGDDGLVVHAEIGVQLSDEFLAFRRLSHSTPFTVHTTMCRVELTLSTQPAAEGSGVPNSGRAVSIYSGRSKARA